MWTWLKNYFGFGNNTDVLVNPVVVIDNKDEIVNTVVITEQVEISEETNNTAPAVDLNGMKKDELLTLAKEKGLKANASMNKQALIALING